MAIFCVPGCYRIATTPEANASRLTSPAQLEKSTSAATAMQLAHATASMKDSNELPQKTPIAA
jgi:hypothetical protein